MCRTKDEGSSAFATMFGGFACCASDSLGVSLAFHFHSASFPLVTSLPSVCTTSAYYFINQVKFQSLRLLCFFAQTSENTLTQPVAAFLLQVYTSLLFIFGGRKKRKENLTYTNARLSIKLISVQFEITSSSCKSFFFVPLFFSKLWSGFLLRLTSKSKMCGWINS